MTTTSNNTLSLFSESEFECTLCLKLLCEPVTASCGHSFCKFCLHRWLLERPICPLCREDLSFLTVFNLRVNVLLQQVLSKLFAQACKDRKAEVDEEAQEFYDTIIVHKKIVVGNLHQLKRQQSSNEQWHLWTCFVRVGNSTHESNEYLEKVQFTLHPTFSPAQVTCNKAPFELQRLGWGIFAIRIKMWFKNHWNHEPMEVNHMLSFDGNGDMKEYDVDFKIKKQQQQQQEIVEIEDEVVSVGSDNDE